MCASASPRALFYCNRPKHFCRGVLQTALSVDIPFMTLAPATIAHAGRASSTGPERHPKDETCWGSERAELRRGAQKCAEMAGVCPILWLTRSLLVQSHEKGYSFVRCDVSIRLKRVQVGPLRRLTQIENQRMRPKRLNRTFQR
eukprot:5238589-Pleurochrysis_carterae.AAC.2